MSKTMPLRTSWFTDARFGMFIHFGLYSMAARHEWMKKYELISDEDYQVYFDLFDPDLFAPAEWAKAARSAGMKYAVFTAKHHEGFCLWDSAFTDYKVTNTPAGKDLLREVLDAFRAEGLRVGIYYSLIDWHHPDFTIDTLHPLCDAPNREELNRNRDMAKYRQYMKDQITELLTGYGKIDILWTDFSYPKFSRGGKGHLDWDSEGLLALIRRLQPELLINDRLDLPPGNADIDTSVEQFLPENPVVDDSGRLLAWEACHTFSGSWGYHREERTWKSVKMCIDLLVQHVAYGGNMILNVGPTSRGKLDRRTKERLSGMGQWMELNSRAIYGCTRAPKKFVPPADCRYTYNPENRRLYLCLLNWPYLYIHLPGLGGGKVKYTQLLADGSEIKRRESAEEQNGSTPPGALTLDLPTLLPEEGCEVPVIEIIFEDSFLSTFEDE